MRVIFTLKTMVEGSPKLIAWWLQARYEEFKCFPHGAYVREGDWGIILPEDPTPEQMEDIIKEVTESQFNYVIAHAMRQKKGSYIRLTYKTDITIPGSKVPLTRVSEVTVRLEARRSYEAADGKGDTVARKLPFGEWREGYKGLIIHHSKKAKTKDKTDPDYGKIMECDYLRYYAGKCKKKYKKGEKEKLLAEGKEPIEYTSHRKERYFFGNKEVDLDSISKESAEKAKKINKSKPSDIFQVDINNILALGKEW